MLLDEDDLYPATPSDDRKKKSSPVISIEIRGFKVPITTTSEIAYHQLRAATVHRPFIEWTKKLDLETRFKVEGIHFQSIDMFGERVGFIKFKADVTNPTGDRLPGIVFMRGNSVAVLVILECGGDEYALLVKQPRLATGQFELIEVVAGMLDDSGSFVGAAAKELEEETGIIINEAGLIDLTDEVGPKQPIYLSPGGSDEAMRFFLDRRRIARKELADLQGKITGNHHEGEHLALHLVPLRDLRHIPNAGTQITYLFYQQYKFQEHKKRHPRG